MKYVIIPILKILWLLSLVIIATPVRWIHNLIFHFRIISIREALTFDEYCLLDENLKTLIKDVFSKDSTNYFLDN